LTKDHRTDDPDEVERIKKTGGFMFKGRVLGVLVLTSSLFGGSHCMKSYATSLRNPLYEKKTIELSSDPSFLILACDGLWEVMEDQQAVDFVLKYQDDKENRSKYLINEALRRGSTGNITAWLQYCKAIHRESQTVKGNDSKHYRQ
jgi:serine/threonine protein phosphatase PrpC